MSDQNASFPVGIEFPSVLEALSKQIYDTPHAFIRENVQNAIDAVRIQALRDGLEPGDAPYQIDVTVCGSVVTVRDNGIGMSREHLRDYFWTIGSSGKRGKEAQAAGCVGMFGIGGFANFGVCETLSVASQSASSSRGTLTRLSSEEMRQAGATIPSVTVSDSSDAAPRGTVVSGELKRPPNADDLKAYLRTFVRFVPVSIRFNGENISQESFGDLENRDNLRAVGVGSHEWRSGDTTVVGKLWEDGGHTLVVEIEKLVRGNESIAFTGRLRLENGSIDVFKRGFKLCATQVPSTIGISGRMECDLFVPTAGRDSIDGNTASLLGQIGFILEEMAIDAVLASAARVAQHTRIFRVINRRGLFEKMGNVVVRLADGTEMALARIQERATVGGVRVFFGTTQKHALTQVMHSQGHMVVQLSADRHRRAAEQSYLERYCAAQRFEGIVDCAEAYDDLTVFERIVLSEIEQNIARAYEIRKFELVAGRLTEDIPTLVKERDGRKPVEIIVDVRHREVAKLESLGLTPLVYSLIAVFCREYIGPSLRKWSPRFFGDGALNLELIAKRRSDLWVLVKDDIGVVRKGGQRQVVTSRDVTTLNVADPSTQPATPEMQRHRLLHIIDEESRTTLGGYFIRLPDWAFDAYGDLVVGCDRRAVVWVGNKLMFVASDGVSAQFQYEIRLDEIVAVPVDGGLRAEGALGLQRPLQEMFQGVYFPIPDVLEQFLVPAGIGEIRLDLHCEWIDMRSRKLWETAE